MTDSDAEDHETEPAAAASGPPSSPVVTTVKVGRSMTGQQIRTGTECWSIACGHAE